MLEITQLLVQEVDEGRGGKRRRRRRRGRDGGGKSRKKVGRGSGTSGSGDSSTSSEGKRKRASRKEAVKLIQTRRYDEINEERERKREERSNAARYACIIVLCSTRSLALGQLARKKHGCR